MEDPFFVVKEDVVRTMAEVDALYTNWRTLLAGDTANNDEFTWTAGEINEKLKAVQPDIQDLEDTVAIVEQHPTKFSLAANELTERKRFISSVKQRIQDIVSDMSSPATRGKIDKDQRQALMKPTRSAPVDPREQARKNAVKDNQRFIDENSAQLLIERQDVLVDRVGESVGILRQQANDISIELDEQARITEELENRVDNTSNKMSNAIKKVNEVLKMSNDKISICCIVALIVIIVILAVFVIL